MAKKVYTLRLNADGTISVRVGRQRETISLLHKDRKQIFDAVKYALISKDAFVSDERLTEDLYWELWRFDS